LPWAARSLTYVLGLPQAGGAERTIEPNTLTLLMPEPNETSLFFVLCPLLVWCALIHACYSPLLVTNSDIFRYVLGAVETFLDAVPSAGFFQGHFQLLLLSMLI
jgi:hypothetical protein